MKIKVIDFNFAESTKKGELIQAYRGTKRYMAPEILRQKPHNGHITDMYAVGVLLYAMVVGQFPFLNSIDKCYKVFCLNPDDWANAVL